jgi:diacylglycerol kinase (ATP)
MGAMGGWIRTEANRLKMTCVWSWAGWRAAWATEKTLRQWFLANLISAVLAFVLPLSATQQALIVALGMLVLAAELMNTAIEEVVDYISTERHPRAEKAKDCGSAAVALTALAAGVAWALVLWDIYGA